MQCSQIFPLLALRSGTWRRLQQEESQAREDAIRRTRGENRHLSLPYCWLLRLHAVALDWVHDRDMLLLARLGT